ncbi:MAG TPA: hypothetical protein VHB21_11255 [Minicystis sp.]|nr:hypothetical protein [Minicystis sp.]
MSRTDAELDAIARALALGLRRPTNKTRAIFDFTLRGFDYDSAIAAMSYGLRAGILRERGGGLVESTPPAGR